MYNMDKANELHKNIRQMMGELKHEYDCLYNYLISKPDADEAYKKGLDEAWELAKRLIRQTSPDDLRRMGFGDSIRHENLDAIVLTNFTASEALAKLRDYEEKKNAEDEAVKVGDEVTYTFTDNGGVEFNSRFVVCIIENGLAGGINSGPGDHSDSCPSSQ